MGIPDRSSCERFAVATSTSYTCRAFRDTSSHKNHSVSPEALCATPLITSRAHSAPPRSTRDVSAETTLKSTIPSYPAATNSTLVFVGCASRKYGSDATRLLATVTRVVDIAVLLYRGRLVSL